MTELAEAVLHLAVGIERLAPRAVPALVGAQIDVSSGLHPAEDLFDGLPVARLGRADEIVVRDLEARVQIEVVAHDGIGELDLPDSELCRGPFDLLPVLVGAGHQADLVAHEAPETRDHVGDDRRVHVPDVRTIVHIVDRRRDVPGPRHPVIASSVAAGAPPVRSC